MEAVPESDYRAFYLFQGGCYDSIVVSMSVLWEQFLNLNIELSFISDLLFLRFQWG